MREQIETHKIFLDTSVFIKENFFAGKKLKAFLKHAETSDIELITTPITLEESLSNIAKFSSVANSAFKRQLKELNNKAKIFKNIPILTPIFTLGDEFKYDEEIKDLARRFTKQINEYFTIVPIDSETTLKVLKDYFDFKPPFKDGKKKHEFPDAFVLNSLESWCKTKKEKMYIVTDDEDFVSFDSSYLIPVRDYDRLLEQISFTFSDANMLPKVEALIKDKEYEIIERIKEVFTDEFPWDGFDDNQGYEYEVHGLDKIEAFIDYFYVLYFYGNTASVELVVPVTYTADVSYEDTSTGWYDKEDEIWYHTESVDDKIECESILKVIIEVTIELPGKPVKWEEWEFKEISSGIPPNIKIR